MQFVIEDIDEDEDEPPTTTPPRSTAAPRPTAHGDTTTPPRTTVSHRPIAHAGSSRGSGPSSSDGLSGNALLAGLHHAR